MQHFDEHICLLRLRDGSSEALDRLYMEYAKSVYSFARALLEDDDEASDITQNVFLKIWEKRKSMDKVVNFKGYLYRMVRNASLDLLVRRRTEPLDAATAEAYGVADISGELDARELRTIVNMAVACMSEQRRTVFTLSRIEGLSHREISQRLNISEKTVEYHISMALKDIRSLLA